MKSLLDTQLFHCGFFFFFGGGLISYILYSTLWRVSESTLSASILKLTSIILLCYFSILNLAVLPRRPFCIPFGFYFFWNRITEFLTEVFRGGPSFPVHLNLCLPAAWFEGCLGKRTSRVVIRMFWPQFSMQVWTFLSGSFNWAGSGGGQ